jgi:hypothetical protein
MLMGAGFGATIGVLVYGATRSRDEVSNSVSLRTNLFAGTLAGTFLGAVVSLVPKTHWIRVKLPPHS